jgi:hypothetical protein
VELYGASGDLRVVGNGEATRRPELGFRELAEKKKERERGEALGFLAVASGYL